MLTTENTEKNSDSTEKGEQAQKAKRSVGFAAEGPPTTDRPCSRDAVSRGRSRVLDRLVLRAKAKSKAHRLKSVLLAGEELLQFEAADHQAAQFYCGGLGLDLFLQFGEFFLHAAAAQNVQAVISGFPCEIV